ncbi:MULTISPECIES: CBS domain-containing protein [Caballeronia]|uniref:CBS domain-containing protein n=1 Tax=unclassified Caballeronia TaxID=2646786 RepID=UPI000314C789|nr:MULTISPECIES: CBS domain-containing protein [Caballeronia]MCG7401793.1 CBS domain-containing protein [Caballeronia zhejiangensis]MCI1046037.1 CBS domain-containing protein [Caballeronia zhejiangensis]MDR5767976.1 CBS domain-containing protein [Caballeronia sp. LZ028]MDR5791051.1 CBS domain-containing protein [Caballeronia sp. LP003]MDR5796579.1 CBS domain-containing protein [Caballeronia sp. LZ008]
MRAADIMTTSIVSASPDMSVRQAAGTMVFAGISGMPVIDEEGNLLGIVTEGDLMHRAEIGTGVKQRAWWLELVASTRELASQYVKEHARKVSDVMTTDVATVSETCPVADIAELLERKRIKRVPVLRDGKVVGVVSRANLIRALVTMAPELPVDADITDHSIREAVIAAMSGHPWALARENVIVENGTVHLWMTVTNDDEAKAVRVAAENAPGVKEVVTHVGPPRV